QYEKKKLAPARNNISFFKDQGIDSTLTSNQINKTLLILAEHIIRAHQDLILNTFSIDNPPYNRDALYQHYKQSIRASLQAESDLLVEFNNKAIKKFFTHEKNRNSSVEYDEDQRDADIPFYKL